MTKKDLTEFTALWQSAAGLLQPTKPEPSDMAIMLAFRTLAQFEIADIRRALTQHITDTTAGSFMPKPADLIRHIEGDTESRALIAWSKVDDTMHRAGSWQSVVFDDPLIMACIDEMGGWLSLCKTTDDEMPFKRQEFTKRYRGYINRPPSSYPSKLIGDIEAEAAILGQDPPEPLLVGNTQAALDVHRSGYRTKQRAIPLAEAIERLKLEHKASDDGEV